MSIFVFYDQQTGEIDSLYDVPESFVDNYEIPDGKARIFIDRHIETKDYRVIDSTLEQLPDSPYLHGKFNYLTGEWEKNTELETSIALRKRSTLLLDSDWTDTVSAVQRLGEEKYHQWQIYRQALRDITLQPGFPENAVWPEKPD